MVRAHKKNSGKKHPTSSDYNEAKRLEAARHIVVEPSPGVQLPIEIILPNGTKRWKCPEAGCNQRAYTRKKDCQRHQLASHARFRGFRCGFVGCERKHAQRGSCIDHILNHHIKGKGFPCGWRYPDGSSCVKILYDASSRARHVQEQHSGKAFVCPFSACHERAGTGPKRYKRKATFKLHVLKLHKLHLSDTECDQYSVMDPSAGEEGSVDHEPLFPDLDDQPIAGPSSSRTPDDDVSASSSSNASTPGLTMGSPSPSPSIHDDVADECWEALEPVPFDYVNVQSSLSDPFNVSQPDSYEHTALAGVSAHELCNPFPTERPAHDQFVHNVDAAAEMNLILSGEPDLHATPYGMPSDALSTYNMPPFMNMPDPLVAQDATHDPLMQQFASYDPLAPTCYPYNNTIPQPYHEPYPDPYPYPYPDPYPDVAPAEMFPQTDFGFDFDSQYPAPWEMPVPALAEPTNVTQQQQTNPIIPPSLPDFMTAPPGTYPGSMY